MVCRAKYCRMASGILSMSSPVSIVFLAKSFILARLLYISHCSSQSVVDLPVLEPNLNRPLRHVNFLRDAFSYRGGRGRVFAEFHL
jgi:hypothetical protein